MTRERSSKIVEIAHARRRFGYRRIHDMLRPHFPGVNHKRVYRLYSAANLAVRKRKKVKRPVSERVPLQLATTVNEVWSMDFVSDSLSTGRRIKCLTVADDFSHECVSISVDWGISGQYVTRLLDQAAVFRGYPLAVRTDNGPEFTSRAFMGWAQTHGIRHILIEPGRPMQNGYIESFNGKFRDECLNEQWFETLQQAWSAITLWRQDYNEVSRTAVASECHRRSSPSCIAGALAMQLEPAQQPPRSINLATPDFLVMNGTAEGGRSKGVNRPRGIVRGTSHPSIRTRRRMAGRVHDQPNALIAARLPRSGLLAYC
ncbi:Transposase InsO and inactivated derivatives [Variovorax sp. OV700]|nr:Transposase InsO and inactivated derivatives [Variovorax sp. OV700]